MANTTMPGAGSAGAPPSDIAARLTPGGNGRGRAPGMNTAEAER